MARGFNKYSAEDYAEMVRLAKLHGSMRKAARRMATGKHDDELAGTCREIQGD